MDKLRIEEALRHALAAHDFELYTRLADDPHTGKDHICDLVDLFVDYMNGDVDDDS